MSTESASNKIPEEALNAFLDGMLTELKSPPDPAMLTSVRAIFRKRIPLHLRSYAAALLILRAAGVTRALPVKAAPPAPRQQKEPQTPRQQNEAAAPKPARAPRQTVKEASPDKPRKIARTQEGMIPLFVSMGKRQRLKPQELRVLISEKSGIPSEELGRVHLFDNYSFLDVAEVQSERIIVAMEGAEINGRRIEVKPAKKRTEEAADKDKTE